VRVAKEDKVHRLMIIGAVECRAAAKPIRSTFVASILCIYEPVKRTILAVSAYLEILQNFQEEVLSNVQ